MIAKRSTKHNGRHTSEPTSGRQAEALTKRKENRRLWIKLGACATVIAGLLAGAKATGELDNIPMGHEVSASQDQEPQPLSIGPSWMDNMRQDITATSEEWQAEYTRTKEAYMLQTPKLPDFTQFERNITLGAVRFERVPRDVEYDRSHTINPNNPNSMTIEQWHAYAQQLYERHYGSMPWQNNQSYAYQFRVVNDFPSGEPLLGNGFIIDGSAKTGNQVTVMSIHNTSTVESPITVNGVEYNEEHGGAAFIALPGDRKEVILPDAYYHNLVQIFTFELRSVEVAELTPNGRALAYGAFDSSVDAAAGVNDIFCWEPGSEDQRLVTKWVLVGASIEEGTVFGGVGDEATHLPSFANPSVLSPDELVASGAVGSRPDSFTLVR